MTGSRFRPSRRRADRPTGVEPEAAPAPTALGVRERARLRRRVRELRALHEFALRDLGGLVFDLYRFGRQRDTLVRDKLERTLSIDQELRAHEATLGREEERARELRLTGVGGTCPNCDEPYGSTAKFCARCGIEFAHADWLPQDLESHEGHDDRQATTVIAPHDDQPSEDWPEGEAEWTDEYQPLPPELGQDNPQPDDDPAHR
jgi:hypothetical protein